MDTDFVNQAFLNSLNWATATDDEIKIWRYQIGSSNISKCRIYFPFYGIKKKKVNYLAGYF